MSKLKLLEPARPKMAYLKMGLFGDTGSGKTWTASEVAIGLHKHIKAKKPVAFFDTETGSSFVIPKFKDNKIELYTFNGTSLKDLTQVMDEAEEACSILIIDSITNVWDEFTDAYMKKKGKSYIELWDWKPIKKEWRVQFRDRFVNSKLHIIMCGREGAIYTSQEEQRGNKIKLTTVKSGTKMRAEGDTGYEPSLLAEMEKVYLDGKASYVRRCNIIKERFGIIDSKIYDNPTFKDFMPHVEKLNLGGEHLGIDTTTTSEDLFGDDSSQSYVASQRNRTILCEEIQGILVDLYPGQTAPEKKIKASILADLFGTRSWTAVEGMDEMQLSNGLTKLVEFAKAARDKVYAKEDKVEDYMNIVKGIVAKKNKEQDVKI